MQLQKLTEIGKAGLVDNIKAWPDFAQAQINRDKENKLKQMLEGAAVDPGISELMQASQKTQSEMQYRLERARYNADQEAREAARIEELLALLERNPDVKRILELMGHVF